MAININGTSGISGVDGSAGTPALQGSDTNTGISFGTDTVNINTGGTTRATVDSSGRVLVGTSSTSSVTRAVIQGNSAGNSQAIAYFQRGSANPSGPDQLAELKFADSNGSVGAEIAAFSDGAWASNDYPGRLVFSTTADGASSPTERMRISSDGWTNLFTGNDGFQVRNSSVAGTSTANFVGRYSASSTASGTNSFVVWTNGNVQNTNNSYTALSDVKLKENIVDANSQWDDIKALQVRNYNLIEGQTHRQIGLIAQEVEPISPGLVYESPDRDEDGNDLGTVTKSVNYSVLYMKAVKALQEAMERIEQLETEMAEVKAQLS